MNNSQADVKHHKEYVPQWINNLISSKDSLYYQIKQDLNPKFFKLIMDSEMLTSPLDQDCIEFYLPSLRELWKQRIMSDVMFPWKKNDCIVFSNFSGVYIAFSVFLAGVDWFCSSVDNTDKQDKRSCQPMFTRCDFN